MLKKIIGISLISILASCGNFNSNSSLVKPDAKVVIEGNVQFPINLKRFTTKVTRDDVLLGGTTISLINPITKKTEGVAITNDTGSFTLVSGSSLEIDRKENTPYILEAHKKFSASTLDPISGKFISLRTILTFRLNTTTGLLNPRSITGSVSTINSTTTALALLHAQGKVTTEEIMAKINSTTTVLPDFNATVTSAVATSMVNNVNDKLTNNLDPFTNLFTGTTGGGTQIDGQVETTKP